MVGKFWMVRTDELMVSMKVPAARTAEGLLSSSTMKEKVPELQLMAIYTPVTVIMKEVPEVYQPMY